jgi:hypothetical protein
MHLSFTRTSSPVRSPRPSSLLAARVVVQPYGFWHRPWVRAGAMALGLALGALAVSWVVARDGDAGGERAALKTELAAAQSALDAERLRAAELARELELLERESRRLREELASQQRAAKRRERAPVPSESAAAVPPVSASVPASVPASVAEAPAAPRTD